MEVFGVGAGEAEGGFEVEAVAGGFVAVGGGGEVFVFLAGGFDFGFPVGWGAAFELHEVGHVVAGGGEGGEGLAGEGGVGLGVVADLAGEGVEFAAGFGEAGGFHFGLGDFEAEAAGFGGLFGGELGEGLLVGGDGGGPVLGGDGAASLGEVVFGVVEGEAFLAGAEVVGGHGEGKEEPEGEEKGLHGRESGGRESGGRGQG